MSIQKSTKPFNETIKSSSLPVLPHTVIKLDKQPRMIITREFRQLFEFFCEKNRAVEWSGVMFYRVQGNINNISEMIITPLDILLMDIGTTAHTEFTMSPEVVDYEINEGLFGCGRGLIHSHNNMNVFFSSEDISELNDVAPLYLYYVSLIVNNKSEMMAKIALVGDMDSRIIYSTSLDQKNPKPVPVELIKAKHLLTVDLQIESDVTLSVNTKYQQRLNKILNSKVIANKALVPSVLPTNAKPSWKGKPFIPNDTWVDTHVGDLFSTVPLEITDEDVVDFLAALLQENDTLTLKEILDNLINDASYKAGEIASAVEEECEEALVLIFGDIDENTQVRVIDRLKAMISADYLKKPKIKAIVTGLSNYISNLDSQFNTLQQW